jgi:hypothetical protein
MNIYTKYVLLFFSLISFHPAVYSDISSGYTPIKNIFSYSFIQHSQSTLNINTILLDYDKNEVGFSPGIGITHHIYSDITLKSNWNTGKKDLYSMDLTIHF